MTPTLPAGTKTEPATLWASYTGGSSWRRGTAPCDSGGPGMLAAWSPTGLALACGSQPGAGSQGKSFYSSNDGGVHWHNVDQIPFGPGYLLSFAAASATRWIWGQGVNTQIEVTRTGGHSWHQAIFTGRTSGTEGWGYVAFTSPSNAVALPSTLNGSVIAFSHDAGRSWQEAPFPTSRLVYGAARGVSNCPAAARSSD